MNYHLIDYKIRQNYYSLWRFCKNKFDIIKNENGTYREYNDLIIRIVLYDNYIIELSVITDDNVYKKEIQKIIQEIISKENIQLDEFCLV